MRKPGMFRQEWLQATGRFLSGFLILWLCLSLGTWLREVLHLMIPGNVMGLFLLLALLATGVIRLAQVELASKCLLYFMPLLFVPVFVGAGAYQDLWAKWSWLVFPALFLAVSAMWIVVGHLAQRAISRNAEEPSANRTQQSI